MKKTKKIIIIALCFALLLSMFTFSTFAADDPSDGGGLDAAAALSNTVWYVDSGWFIDSNAGSFYLSSTINCFSGSAFSAVFDNIYLGVSYDSEGEPGYLSNSISLKLSDDSYFNLSSSDDFSISFGDLTSVSSDLTPLYDFLNTYGELIYSPGYFSDFFYHTYDLINWSVPAGYSDDFILGLTINDLSGLLMYGYYGSIASPTPIADSIMLIVSFDSPPVIFTPSDSLVFYFPEELLLGFVEDEAIVYQTASVYFIKNYGTMHVIPTDSDSLLSDIFSSFGFVGSWISGAASSLVPMFWTGTELTFVGMLSVSSLALSVVFLVLYFIERFLRFGGG